MGAPEDPHEPPPYFSPPPPGPPQFGSPEYGQPQYGVSQFGAPPPYGGAPYGQPPWGAQYAGGAPYASWIQRVGASLLDGLVSGVPSLILVFAGFAIGHGVGVVVLVLGYLLGIAIFIWNVVIRQGTTGQTIGKSALGIKLIREMDGQVVGPGMSFVRQLAHIVDGFVCDLGYLWPLWDAKRQTFADKICSTIVIQI